MEMKELKVFIHSRVQFPRENIYYSIYYSMKHRMKTNYN